MVIKRSSSRPNVTSAKDYTIGDYVESLSSHDRVHKYLKQGKLVDDVCDICHRYIVIQRKFLGLRVRGYKLVCRECYSTTSSKEKMIYGPLKK